MDKFRIQNREMSADVIEENLGTDKKPKWVVRVCPTSVGRNDILAHDLCDFLNNRENELNLNC